MLASSFYKIFPIPKFLELSRVGIDISDESIKFAELVRKGSSFSLGKHGCLNLPAGTIVSGKINNLAALVESLSRIKKENNFEYVYTSLPEEESFVARMDIPWIKKTDLRSSVELQLESYIPMPVEQASFDFEIYQEPAKQTENYILGVYVSSREIITSYTEAYKKAGLIPMALELEVQSAARAFVPNDSETYMLVDMGKTRTGFSIVSRGLVLFSSTIKSIGGENMTKAIQKNLGISYEEAENLKIKKGLLNSPENKTVFESLVPIVSLFKDEINRHNAYWHGLIDTGVANPINKIFLTGGQALLPGLTEYMSASLKAKVELGNPWQAFHDVTKEIPPINFVDAQLYGTAIGLALRGTKND